MIKYIKVSCSGLWGLVKIVLLDTASFYRNSSVDSRPLLINLHRISFLAHTLIIFFYKMSTATAPGFRKQAPSDFLKQIMGKPVSVKLNSGVDYRGR